MEYLQKLAMSFKAHHLLRLKHAKKLNMNKINPPLFKKVANFTTAAFKHVADNLERLTEDQYLLRLDVCQGNGNNLACEAYNSETSICRDWRCGCSIKKKAYWRSEDCPRGLWPRITITEDKNDQKL